MTRPRIYCSADLNRAATLLRLHRVWQQWRPYIVVAAVLLAYGVAGTLESPN